MAEQTITIRTRTELSALRQLEDRLEKEIVQARVLGKEFGEMERQLGNVREEIGRMPKGKRMSGDLQNALAEIPGVGGVMRAMSGPAGAIAAGVGGAGVFAKFAKDGADAARQIRSVSQQTDIASDTVQAFNLALNSFGVGVDRSNGSLTKFNEKLGDAKLKGGEAKLLFDKLGVSFADNEGKVKSTEVVLQEVIQAMSEMEDASERGKIAAELFGDAGKYIAEAFDEGTESLSKFKRDFKNQIFTQKELDNAQTWGRVTDAALTTLRVKAFSAVNAIATLDMDKIADLFRGGGAGMRLFTEDLPSIYQASLEATLKTGEGAAKLLTTQEQIVKQTAEEVALRKQIAKEEDAIWDKMQRRVEQNEEQGKFKSVDEIIAAGEAGKMRTPEQQLEVQQAKLAKSYEGIAEQNRGTDPAKSSKYFRAAEVMRGRIGSLASSAGGGQHMLPHEAPNVPRVLPPPAANTPDGQIGTVEMRAKEAMRTAKPPAWDYDTEVARAMEDLAAGQKRAAEKTREATARALKSALDATEATERGLINMESRFERVTKNLLNLQRKQTTTL